MLASLPIYIESRKVDGKTLHVCRPAFLSSPSVSDEHLGLALNRLRRRLKQQLDEIAAFPRHEILANCLFRPNFETHMLSLTLDLRERRVKCKLLWLVFTALNRRIAMTPVLQDQWIELVGSQKLEDRCRDVLTKYFRRQEKLASRGEAAILPESLSLDGNAWITTIDLDLNTRQTSEKKLERTLASLLEESQPDGASELQAVGRCLDWLYPDDLLRGVAREREAEELVRLLAARDRRPLAVVGPRLVGKTTVIHEAVRRRVAGLANPQSPRRNVWLVAPQRLVSGMMYVGQWEGRVQAILREMRRRQHVLYVDDFLGLYHAGISRDAQLSVAEVLKPFILRRDVRVLSEFTSEGWQAFQERDRGLADQFHVLRVAPTNEAETRRVMFEVHRQLEAEHGVTFDLGVLPAVLRLHGSYIRDAAFPGKAAAFSRQLARKRSQQPITRDSVYDEFHARTGLAPALIDDRQRLERHVVETQMRARVVGQDEAVQSAVEIVLTAKAQLADPSRPLATLLYLGPTGVGKTQCAKALAKVMFSDAQRLVRFDMNEFVTAYSAAQLAGTSENAEGLLTSAVRRQPFCVVLLDEIEKAHPDVFDLLLQVLGEGRLTDSLGRTTDFSNAVIVMTSNLGTTANRGALGLAATDGVERARYVKAAEQFFRPEFFNRIDRVIPFQPLSRAKMRDIANLILEDVLQRDGLVRRRCALSIEPAAMERIVDAGYHPQFGARALKREIERQLIQPIAATLAATQIEVPALVRVWPGVEGVTAEVHPLEPVPMSPPRPSADEAPQRRLAQVDQYLARVDQLLAAAKAAVVGAARGVSREQVRYFAFKEQWRRVRERADQLREDLNTERQVPRRPGTAPRAPAAKDVRGHDRAIPVARMLRDLQSARDIHDYVRELAAAAPPPAAKQRAWNALWDEVALLHACETSVNDPERVLMLVRPLVREQRVSQQLLGSMLTNLAVLLAYEVDRDGATIDIEGEPWMKAGIAGPGIWPLMRAEAGVHVYCREGDHLVPLQVAVLPIGEGPLAEHVEAFRQRYLAWQRARAAGEANDSDDPLPLGRLIRFYNEDGSILDFRTGMSLPSFNWSEEGKKVLLAGLPLPPEVSQA